MPPGIELSRQRAAPNTEILERSQALSLGSSSSDENTVVKPHGRLVPVS
jgi:hypothetical protein